MKRKFLEDLGLDKEVIDKILDENSADIGKAKGEVSTLEDKVKNLESELSTTKEQVADRDKQIEGLKKVDAAGLQAEIERLQTENKTKDEVHAAEVKNLKIESAVNAALTGAKALNVKAVRALLDLTGAELDDKGEVKGLAEKIKALQTADDSKFLFDSTKNKMKGAEPGEGTDPKDPGITKEQFQKMSYKERVELYNTDKELYDSLVE